MKRIGFIGLGTMGLPMANNLLKAGYDLVVYNRTLDKAKQLNKTAKVAASPAEVALETDVIFTMLTADSAVLDIYFGEKGIAEGVSEGQIILDCSTISPNTSKKVGMELAKLGVEFLDAPVTGSEPQAIEGSLTFMAGGKEEVFKACQPFFGSMGKAAYYMGEAGAGSYMKLANNTLVSINLLALSESLTMAAKSGINPELFIKVVSAGGARSGMIDYKAPKILNRDFHPNFATELMYKDLGLAGNLASELKIPVPFLSLAKEMMQMTIVKGFSREDMCSVVKCYEEWAGIEIKKRDE